MSKFGRNLIEKIDGTPWWMILIYIAIIAAALFVVANSTNAEILSGDTANYFIFTSAIPIDSVYVEGYFTNLSTPDFTDTLDFISGSEYSFEQQRTFTTLGKWKFKFTFTDTAGDDEDHTTSDQWFTDVVTYDTLMMQGAASGLTAKVIWHYGDGTDTARTVHGWGGSSLREITLIIQDASSSANIEGVQIKIYDTATASPAFKGGPRTTDVNGEAVFYLDTLDFDLRMFHNNYTFTNPTTISIGEALTDTSITLTGTAFDPDAPASASMVRVWGYIKDINDAVAIGVVVRASLMGKQKVWRGSTAITPYARQDTTDADGYWRLDLYPNDSLTPTGTHYFFEMIDSVAIIGSYTVFVPADSAGADWEFTPDR